MIIGIYQLIIGNLCHICTVQLNVEQYVTYVYTTTTFIFEVLRLVTNVQLHIKMAPLVKLLTHMTLP